MNSVKPQNKPYRRLNAEESRARYETIKAALLAGKSPKLIAQESGVQYGRVRAVIHNDKALQALHQANRKSPVGLPPVGAITAAIRKQSEGFQQWLVRSVPEGTTLADFMVSAALDSYMDETEETSIQKESDNT